MSFTCPALTSCVTRCHVPAFDLQDEAQAAIEGLSGLHKFDGYPDCDSPMVVEWMDASRLTPPSGTHMSHAARLVRLCADILHCVGLAC